MIVGLSVLAVYLLGVSFWFGAAYGNRTFAEDWKLSAVWPLAFAWAGVIKLRIPCRLKGHDDRRVTLSVGDGGVAEYGVQCKRPGCKRVEEL